MVANLDQEDRIAWAELQRKEGNKLFEAGYFDEAIDVYLTCLVAVEKEGKKGVEDDRGDTSDEVNNSVDDGGGDRALEQQEGREKAPTLSTLADRTEREIQLPVLLNLSLCSLKRGRHNQAEKFCNFAMELTCGRADPRVHYRRGKARMLLGSYTGARSDLEVALDIIDENCKSEEGGADVGSKDEQRNAVLKELLRLEHLEKAGKKNEAAARRAMRLFLAGKNDGHRPSNGDSFSTVLSPDKQGPCTKGSNYASSLPGSSTVDFSRRAKGDESSGLYQDLRQRRAYSTLRAKPKNELREECSYLNDSPEITYLL